MIIANINFVFIIKFVPILEIAVRYKNALLFSAISLIMLAYTNRFLAYAALIRHLDDKYLEKKGEGIHHIAFKVENIEEEIKRMQAEGFEMIHKEPKRGADNMLIAFLHPKGTNGVLVELCQEITE